MKSKKTINKKTNYKEATREETETDIAKNNTPEEFEPTPIFEHRNKYFSNEEKNQERLRILREAKKKIQTRSVVN